MEVVYHTSKKVLPASSQSQDPLENEILRGLEGVYPLIKF